MEITVDRIGLELVEVHFIIGEEDKMKIMTYEDIYPIMNDNKPFNVATQDGIIHLEHGDDDKFREAIRQNSPFDKELFVYDKFLNKDYEFPMGIAYIDKEEDEINFEYEGENRILENPVMKDAMTLISFFQKAMEDEEEFNGLLTVIDEAVPQGEFPKDYLPGIGAISDKKSIQLFFVNGENEIEPIAYLRKEMISDMYDALYDHEELDVDNGIIPEEVLDEIKNV